MVQGSRISSEIPTQGAAAPWRSVSSDRSVSGPLHVDGVDPLNPLCDSLYSHYPCVTLWNRNAFFDRIIFCFYQKNETEYAQRLTVPRIGGTFHRGPSAGGMVFPNDWGVYLQNLIIIGAQMMRVYCQKHGICSEKVHCKQVTSFSYFCILLLVLSHLTTLYKLLTLCSVKCRVKMAILTHGE